MNKKHKTRKLLGLLLVMAVLFGCWAVGAFADPAPTTAKVDFTSQYEGSFLHAPQFGVEVDAGLAESYGYTDSVTGVSALDVLVKAHELTFGDAFTKADCKDYLVMGSSGAPAKQFGVDPTSMGQYLGGFFLNHALANDGTMYDANNYNGTMVGTQKVVDGDLVEFFFFEDDSWGDTYNWFVDAEGNYSREFTVKPGEDLKLKLRGFYAMNASLFKDETDMVTSSRIATQDRFQSDAQLYTVNLSTGEKTKLDGKITDDNCEVTLNFPKIGNYAITAYSTEDSSFKQIMSLTTVKVTDSVKVDFTSQKSGEFLHAPQFGVEVDAGLAESYGYADEVTDGVSALDVLVKAHEVVFPDDFDKATCEDYLKIENSTVKKQFGQDQEAGMMGSTMVGAFTVNKIFPSDDTPPSGTPAEYHGLTVTQAPVKDGDFLEFFFGENEYYADLYNWFLDEDGEYSNEFTVLRGDELKLSLRGTYCTNFLRHKTFDELPATYNNNAGLKRQCRNIQLYTIDMATGAKTALNNGVTDNDGDVTLKFDTLGEYVIAAYGSSDFCDFLLTLTTVNVVPATPAKIDFDPNINRLYQSGSSKVLPAEPGYKFHVRAYDAEGNDISDHVTWKNTSYGTWCDVDALSGEVTILDGASLGVGSTSMLYVEATSKDDPDIKYETRPALSVTGWKMQNTEPTVALSADGQTAKTGTIGGGGVTGYNRWTYNIPAGVGQLNAEPGDGNRIVFDAYRPGTITATYKCSLDSVMTETATLTITGVAVESEDGERGKTYVDIGANDPHPMVVLKAFTEPGREIVSWSSADEEVATVDEDGVVTAQGLGRTIITAEDDNGTKGGIMVVVSSADTPYFEMMNFATTAFNSGVWVTNQTYEPTKLSYDLPIKNATTSSLVLQATTLFNEDKYIATADYTDVNGNDQSVPVLNGKMTTLPNQPFDDSVMTITIADKNDAEKKTVYTFNVNRPRDTGQNITTTKCSFAPVGRGLSVSKYNGQAEGIFFRADETGTPTTNNSGAFVTSIQTNHYNYRLFAQDGLAEFKLNLGSASNFAHLRYSIDGGENWTYIGQNQGSTEAIAFPAATAGENAVVKVEVQFLGDKFYTENVNAGKDGFAEGTPTTYNFYVEQLPAIAAEDKPLIRTATTDAGEWIPAFDKENIGAYLLIMPNGTNAATAPTLTYTITDGATVTLGTSASAPTQTPDALGNYTLKLTTSAQSLNVTKNGVTSTYTFRYMSRSAKDVPDKVVDYLPINSQYTNVSYGVTPEVILAGSMKSTGGYGGYVTFYYGNGLKDDPKNAFGVDFYVYGNAFLTGGQTGPSAEPGQVWVSEDGNDWYALAGSDHYDDHVIWDYEITYTKRADGRTNWTDNYGNSNTALGLSTGPWPKAEIYTLNDLAKGDSITLSGILMKDPAGRIASNSGTLRNIPFGYVDIYPATGTRSNPYVSYDTSGTSYGTDRTYPNGFDLAWAVDANGEPIDVSGKEFHYVKVVTMSNVWAAAINEKSTEVAQIFRADAETDEVGKTAMASGVTVSGGKTDVNVDFVAGQQIYDVNVGYAKYVSIAANAADDDNIYINNQRVANGEKATGFRVAENSSRLIRVIVQNGESEPDIRLLRITSSADDTYFVKTEKDVPVEPKVALTAPQVGDVIEGTDGVEYVIKSISEADALTGDIDVTVMAAAEVSALTVPADATLWLGEKNFSGYNYKYFDEMTALSVAEDTAAATKTYQFSLQPRKTYQIRLSGADYITYADLFTTDTTGIYTRTVTKDDLQPAGVTKTTVDHDVTTNRGANVGNLYLNINAQGYLKMTRVGRTYQIVNLRNWEAVDNITTNNFVEPEYHYTVLDEAGNVSDSVVTVDEKGLITATGNGTAIVLVTYDAMTYPSGFGGPFFGAIWPENTGVFVVSVGAGKSGIDTGMTVNEGLNTDATTQKMALDAIDSELDVIYYTGDQGAYTFTPATAGCAVSVANPVIADVTKADSLSYNGFTAVTANEDGSFTVPLIQGRNIVKVEKDGKAEYQVITAKAVSYTINGGNPVYPGDKISVVFDRLYHPCNKLAGVYNMGTSVIYRDVDGYAGKTIGNASNQYTFASSAAAQTVSLVLKEGSFGYYQKDTDLIVPADYADDTLNLAQGLFYTGGFGDPYGNHRYITYTEGKGPNLNAAIKKGYMGVLPDIEIPIAAPDSLEIDDTNVRHDYIERDVFDPTGLVVTAVYANGARVVLDENHYEVTTEPLLVDDTFVTVTAKGLSERILVNVAVDAEEANDVEREIVSLPANDVIVASDAAAITKARADYEDLTDAQKKLVAAEAVSKLIGAERTLEQLGAAPVVNAIDAIPTLDDLTLDDETYVKQVREDYEKLTEVQKAAVKNVSDLIKAETKLKKLAEKAAADTAAAKAVDDQIAALPAADAITVNDEAAVKAARKAFDKLTDDQKALVTKEATLDAAEAALDDAIATAAANALAAGAVEDKIAALPAADDITVDDKAAIKAARKAYDALSDAQKALVKNVADLTAAETALADAIAAVDAAAAAARAADEAAAKVVDTAIENLGDPKDITVNDEAAVKAARKAYDKLTDAQKALVKNGETLEAVEAALDAAITAAAEAAAAEEAARQAAEQAEREAQAKLEADKAAAAKVVNAIKAIGEVTLDSERAIEKARDGYTDLTADQQDLVTNIDDLTAAEATLAQLKADAKAAEEAAAKAAADQAAADAVQDKIDALGNAEDITVDDAKAVAAARKAFDRLTDEQKALVDEEALKAVEAALKAAKEADAKAKADEAAAATAIDAIEALDEASTAAEVAAARAAYDALSDEGKALVPAATVKALKAAEAAVAKAEADAAAAKEVTDKIAALPAADEVTTADAEAIGEALAAYEALTDEQQALVSAETKAALDGAKEALDKAIAQAQKEEQDKAKADEVKGIIAALPAADAITAADKDAVDKAKVAYEALTDDQKALVPEETKKALADAEAAVAKAIADQQAEADKKAADAVKAQIDALPAADKLALTDKPAVEAARKGFNGLTDAQKALVPNEGTLKAAEDKIKELENAKPVPKPQFVDVPADAFYKEAVDWAVSHDPVITTGTDATHFSPNGDCTRGQVVTFLWRANGCPKVEANVSFTDVKADAYYGEAVKWAVSKNITGGVGNNKFDPNGKCTRGQVVTFLWRANGSPKVDAKVNFTDVKSGAYYEEAVKWAVSKEITGGMGDNKFAPDTVCNRGQVVTFLYRAK